MFIKLPGFSKFKINPEGILIRIKDGKKLNWHWSNGYKFVKIPDDYGNLVSVGQHRALCLAFKPLPNTSEKLDVNHINGIRDDNRLENLEWSTRSDNNKHAYLNNLALGVPSIVKDLETNKVYKFKTKRELADFLGVSRGFLSTKKLFKNRTFRFKNFYVEYLNESSLIRKHFIFPNGIIARNIYSNKLIKADNVTQLAALINVHSKVLTRYLYQRKFNYPLNGYDCRSCSEDIVWPTYTEEELNAFKGMMFIHCPIWVISEDGSKKLFGSISKASKYTRCDESQIRRCSKTNKQCSKGFRYKKLNRKVAD